MACCAGPFKFRIGAKKFFLPLGLINLGLKCPSTSWKFTSIERRRSRKSLCAEIARTLVPRLICDTYGSVNGDGYGGGESTASSTLRHQHQRHTRLEANCKYLQTIYSQWLCYISHCNLAAIITVNGCTNDTQWHWWSKFWDKLLFLAIICTTKLHWPI